MGEVGGWGIGGYGEVGSWGDRRVWRGRRLGR